MTIYEFKPAGHADKQRSESTEHHTPWTRQENPPAQGWFFFCSGVVLFPMMSAPQRHDAVSIISRCQINSSLYFQWRIYSANIICIIWKQKKYDWSCVWWITLCHDEVARLGSKCTKPTFRGSKFWESFLVFIMESEKGFTRTLDTRRTLGSGKWLFHTLKMIVKNIIDISRKCVRCETRNMTVIGYSGRFGVENFIF
jgi:hypothetical protein